VTESTLSSKAALGKDASSSKNAVLVDVDLNDISGTDTIAVDWFSNWLRFFLCAKSLPARDGGYQEYCAEPNPGDK